MNMFLAVPGWVTTLMDAVLNFLNPVLILVAIAGMCYAILVGIKFARAEDKSARDEAKQKLITVIIGVAVTAILILVFYWLADALKNERLTLDNWFGTSSEEGEEAVSLFSSMVTYARVMLRI